MGHSNTLTVERKVSGRNQFLTHATQNLNNVEYVVLDLKNHCTTTTKGIKRVYIDLTLKIKGPKEMLRDKYFLN